MCPALLLAAGVGLLRLLPLLLLPLLLLPLFPCLPLLLLLLAALLLRILVRHCCQPFSSGGACAYWCPIC